MTKICLQLSGLAIAAVGLWTILAKYSFVSLLASICYQATAYLLIVCGTVIVLIVFAFGCCGTKRENSCCLGLVSGHAIHILKLLIIIICFLFIHTLLNLNRNHGLQMSARFVSIVPCRRLHNTVCHSWSAAPEIGWQIGAAYSKNPNCDIGPRAFVVAGPGFGILYPLL